MTAWKSILDQRKLIKRGLKWIIGNGQRINLWRDIWFNGYPPFEKQIPNKPNEIKQEAKVSDSFMREKIWKLESHKNYLPEDIINEINNTHIPINNIEVRLVGKLFRPVSSLLNLRLRQTNVNILFIRYFMLKIQIL